MLRYSTLFSSLFPFLLLATGCSSSTPSSPGTSDASTDGATNKCAAAGGQCIALSPSVKCAQGFAPADYAQYPCGDGVGSSCCLPDTHDAGADAAPQYCSPDGAPAPTTAGTCNGSTCSEGCGCALNAQQQGQCFCTGALQPDAGCITVSCGSISCGTGCHCTDTALGTCVCP